MTNTTPIESALDSALADALRPTVEERARAFGERMAEILDSMRRAILGPFLIESDARPSALPDLLLHTGF